MNNLVIGLVGKKQSGKDTLYECLCESYMEHQLKILPFKISFATEIKRDIVNLFGGTFDSIEQNKNHPTVRTTLQFHGSFKREENSSYWIEKAQEYYTKNSPSNGILAVFTDIRHHNEASYIKNTLGGKLIRIHRSDTDKIEDTHESETNIDKISIGCDNFINNDWSIVRLKFMAVDVVKQMFPELR